jgi:uncharacterized membrane protein
MARERLSACALCIVWILAPFIAYAAVFPSEARVVGTIVRVWSGGFDVTIDQKQSDATFTSRGAAPLSVTVDAKTRIVNQNPRGPAAIGLGERVEIIGNAYGGANASRLDASSIRILTETAAAPTPPPPQPAASSSSSVVRTLHVCNNYKVEVYFAFAAQQQHDWTSSGWLRVPTNACKDTRLANYYRGEATLQRLANGGRLTEEWGHGRKFCVADDRFVFHNASVQCAGARFEQYNGHEKSILHAIRLNADGTVDTISMDH